MKLTQIVIRTLAISTLFAGALAQAATVSGTVTNKTTGKPAAGDTVVLVDVQAGMGEVAKATTDANGKYSLNYARQRPVSDPRNPPGSGLLSSPRLRAEVPARHFRLRRGGQGTGRIH